MGEQVTIYGLCDESGTVHYVGQTRRVEHRRREHRKVWPHLTLIALAVVAAEQADEAERHWFNHYRDQGQGALNGSTYMPYSKGRAGAGDEDWIAVRVPKETRERLKGWAERRDTSMSWIVRRLIAEAMESRRDERDGL